MKRNLLLVIFSCLGPLCWAQSLSRAVIGAAGDAFHFNKGSLDWTLGEVATSTYIQESKILTQGFQQPEIKTKRAGSIIACYPNPSKDFAYVVADDKGDYLVEVFTMLGLKVLSKNISATKTPLQIDLRDLGPALYVLRIVDLKTSEAFSFKIEKI